MNRHERDAKELRQLLEAAGLSQAKAAERIGVSLRHMQYQVQIPRDQPVELRTLLAMRWIAQETRKAS